MLFKFDSYKFFKKGHYKIRHYNALDMGVENQVVGEADRSFTTQPSIQVSHTSMVCIWWRGCVLCVIDGVCVCR